MGTSIAAAWVVSVSAIPGTGIVFSSLMIQDIAHQTTAVAFLTQPVPHKLSLPAACSVVPASRMRVEKINVKSPRVAGRGETVVAVPSNVNPRTNAHRLRDSVSMTKDPVKTALLSVMVVLDTGVRDAVCPRLVVYKHGGHARDTEAPANLTSVHKTREKFFMAAQGTVAVNVVPSVVNLENLVTSSRASALMTRDPASMEQSTDTAALGTDVRDAVSPRVVQHKLYRCVGVWEAHARKTPVRRVSVRFPKGVPGTVVVIVVSNVVNPNFPAVLPRGFASTIKDLALMELWTGEAALAMLARDAACLSVVCLTEKVTSMDRFVTTAVRPYSVPGEFGYTLQYIPTHNVSIK
ncbi:hypothetical protein Pcinc_027087 [Petrolisthes cinctipes]|uniref:Uncharacterized protein n=1 Tax=Petrolisthes cinctipes TaxID=88211 RepID=A0AAE1F6R9_PETCI|nr:hypothetical protein Pcinc_027087 [Petrolisthes cinctipes]